MSRQQQGVERSLRPLPSSAAARQQHQCVNQTQPKSAHRVGRLLPLYPIEQDQRNAYHKHAPAGRRASSKWAACVRAAVGSRHAPPRLVAAVLAAGHITLMASTIQRNRSQRPTTSIAGQLMQAHTSMQRQAGNAVSQPLHAILPPCQPLMPAPTLSPAPLTSTSSPTT